MTVSILVVDDECDVAELYRQLFRREVHFAKSARMRWADKREIGRRQAHEENAAEITDAAGQHALAGRLVGNDSV